MAIAKRYVFFVLGWVTSLATLFCMAEIYLRYVTPPDLEPFLGERSSLTGVYRPDPEYAVSYASWQAFYEENAQRLDVLLPAAGGQEGQAITTWMFFGNSFIHANGMLADTARSVVKDRLIFNLGQNTPLPIRFAQVELLLEAGLRPERIFISIMPIDTYPISEFPLSSLYVTHNGAITQRPRLPNRGAWLLLNSRVALAGWVRSGGHRVNQASSGKRVRDGVNPELMHDLERLFGNLAREVNRRGIPTTVLLIPDHIQVLHGASFGFQDDLELMLTRLGFEVFDPRDAFCSHPRPATLFIPDGHMSDTGNQLLLAELLSDMSYQPADRMAGSGSKLR